MMFWPAVRLVDHLLNFVDKKGCRRRRVKSVLRRRRIAFVVALQANGKH